MADGTRPDHHRRYRALDDLRRLGFEQQRLEQRIRSHPDWPDRPLPARRAIDAAITVPPHRPNADVSHLDAAVRAATVRLVLLAKTLRALDTGRPLPDP